MTYQDAQKLMALVLANKPNLQDREINLKPTIKLWATFFANQPYKIMELALLKVMSRSQFFPDVSMISEALQGLKQENLPSSAEEAWLEVMQKLDICQKPEYSSEIIHKAVKAVGYRNICCSEAIGVERAHFMQIYNSYLNREKEEIENQNVMLIAQAMPALTQGKR